MIGKKLLYKATDIRNIIWKYRFFIFKNIVHLHKRLKKTFIDESEKPLRKLNAWVKNHQNLKETLFFWKNTSYLFKKNK